MTDRLVALLLQAIADFTERDEPRGILAEDAPALAAEALRVAGTEPDQVLEAARAGAYLHLCRAIARPDAATEIETAERLFAVVARYDPDAVPPDLPSLVARVILQRSRTGTVADRERAVARAERVVEGSAAGGSALRHDLGVARWEQYVATEQMSDLDRSVAWLRASANSASRPRDRALSLSVLGSVLLARYRATKSSEDLDQAASGVRDAVGLVAPTDPRRPVFLSNLSHVLQGVYEHSGNMADLDAAISRSREAIAATPTGDPELSEMHCILSAALELRYQTGDRAALDEAVDLTTAALSMQPQGTRVMLARASALSLRWLRDRDPRDLDESIDLCLRSAGNLGPGVQRTSILGRAAEQLLQRWAGTRNPTDLDAAVNAGRAALRDCPPDYPGRTAIEDTLTLALARRRGEHGPPDDAVEIVALTRPTTTPNAERSYMRALAFYDRYEQSHEPLRLAEAAAAAAEAVAATGSGDHQMASRAYFAAMTARRCFELSGSLHYLDSAVEYGRTACRTADPDLLPRALWEQSDALRHRYVRRGIPADLESAIELGQNAVNNLDRGDPRRADALGRLGLVMITRFRSDGDLTSINQAITALREAIELSRGDHANNAVWRSDLAIALGARFFQTGERADLLEALGHARLAILHTPQDDPGLAACLSELSRLLLVSFEETHTAADIDEALDAAARAVNLTPPSHSMWQSRQHRLIVGLLTRYAASRRPDGADLDKAIDRCRAVTAAVSASDTEPVIFTSYAEALIMRHQSGREERDLTTAITTLTALLDRLPENSIDRFAALETFGTAKLTANLLETLRRDPAAEVTDWETREAFDSWWEAARMSVVPASERISLLARLGRFASGLGRWNEAVDACAAAADLLPLLAWHGATRPTQERMLLNATGMSGTSAACALEAGERAKAIILLEQTRGVLWAQQTALRTDLDVLTEQYADLAVRLKRVRAEIEAPVDSSEPLAPAPPAAPML